MKTFIPSEYQAAILAYDPFTNGHLDIEAVPGSGKTTTVEQKIMQVSKQAFDAGKELKIKYLVFGKANAVEATAKLPSTTDVSTFHSFCYRIMRLTSAQTDIKEEKLFTCIADYNKSAGVSEEDFFNVTLPALKKLIGLIMANVTDLDDRAAIVNIIDDNDIDCNSHFDFIVSAVKPIIDRMVKDKKHISFAEMLYHVARFDFSMPRFDLVFVDEAQDNSNAQNIIVRKLADAGAKVVFVGDSNQAIYGFRGADSDSMDNLKSLLNATSLPLDLCYRCPSSHLDLVRDIAPNIQARPNAPVGSVESLTLDEMIASGNTIVPNKTIIICRRMNPLVAGALKLLRNGIPAKVAGRDIGDSVITFVKRIAGKGKNAGTLGMVDFNIKLSEYRTREMANLAARNASEAAMVALDDKIETVNVLSEGMLTVNDLINRISEIFTKKFDNADNGKVEVNVVGMYTIHRAKGMEGEIVVILNPSKLELPMKTAKQRRQERNCRFVALTRCSGERMIMEKE